ncbi:hypothetical protein FS749_012801, partial [Ceratobasidium sp. UAMH 11750]
MWRPNIYSTVLLYLIVSVGYIYTYFRPRHDTTHHSFRNLRLYIFITSTMPILIPVATPMSRLNDRWHVYQPKPHEKSLEALNHWEGRAKAKVDWEPRSSRASDNTVTHIVIPLVSCEQYHTVGHDMIPHVRRVCNNPQDSYGIIEQALVDWLSRKGEELVEFELRGCDDQGRYTAWASRYISRLVRFPIQQCEGQGRSLAEAKRNAAEMLLQSRHC